MRWISECALELLFLGLHAGGLNWKFQIDVSIIFWVGIGTLNMMMMMTMI